MIPIIIPKAAAARRALIVALVTLSATLASMARDFTLVIDPGHGGKDYGAIGLITNEKTINLNVARKLGQLIADNYNDVKIVYTRQTDRFISLKDRADIANKAGGDLFISIHVNSVDSKSKNRATVQGTSVYTLGLHRSAANLEVAKRENSVITLEHDYSTTYQGFDPNSSESYIMFELSQNKHMEQSVSFAKEVENEMVSQAGRTAKGVRQAGFWVLWATSMPSVLIELDFICNPEQEKYLDSPKGQDELATSIYNAFRRYKTSFDHSMGSSAGQWQPSAGYGKNEPRRDDNQVKPDKQAKEKDKKDKKEKKGKNGKDKNQSDKEPQPQPQPQTPKTEPQQRPANEDSRQTAIVYRVQFLTSGKRLEKGSRLFKGLYPVWSYRDGGLWKYTYGEAANTQEAEKTLKKIKAKFPDAFIISTRGNQRL